MAHSNVKVSSGAWQLVASAPTLCMIQTRSAIVYANIAASEPAADARGFFVTRDGITLPDLSSAGLNVYLRAQDAADDVSVFTL